MIRKWLRKHGLIIMTGREYTSELNKWFEDIARINRAAIHPVIHDLEKLRANTWDQDKITWMQTWLTQHFEREEDE